MNPEITSKDEIMLISVIKKVVYEEDNNAGNF